MVRGRQGALRILGTKEMNEKTNVRNAWTIFYHNDKAGEFQSRTYLTERSAKVFFVKTKLTNSNAKMTSLYLPKVQRSPSGNARREGKGASKKAAKKARGVLALSGAERDGVP